MVQPQRKSEHLCNKGRDSLEKQGKEKKFPFSKVPIGADIWASEEDETSRLVRKTPVGLSAEVEVVNFSPFLSLLLHLHSCWTCSGAFWSDQ